MKQKYYVLEYNVMGGTTVITGRYEYLSPFDMWWRKFTKKIFIFETKDMALDYISDVVNVKVNLDETHL